LTWNKSIPLSSTQVSQTPSFYQGNWDAIEDFMLEEHYTFTGASSGHHLLGISGVIMEGTTAAITGVVAAPGSGSLSFDNTVGAWKFCSNGTSGGWKTIHNNLPTTRVQSYVSSNTTITSGTTTIIPFNTETKDSISEFNTSTYVFSAAAAGYFVVSATVCVSSVAGNSFSLLASGSATTYKTNTFKSIGNQEAYNVSLIAYVASGGTVGVFLTPSSGNAVIIGGAGNSFMRVYRVS